MIITEERKRRVWEKGVIVPNYDPAKYRKDACGAWIAWNRYDDKHSPYGWQIDHIYPESKLRVRRMSQKSIDHPEDAHAINVGGPLNVLESMKELGVRRVVLAASAAAYGNQPQTPKTESMPVEPLSPYAADKIACEAYMQWAEDVREGVYPKEENGWHMDAAELEKFTEMMEKF